MNRKTVLTLLVGTLAGAFFQQSILFAEDTLVDPEAVIASEERVITEEMPMPETGTDADEDILSSYIQQQFDRELENKTKPLFLKNRGSSPEDRMTPGTAAVFRALRACIAEVAAGNRTSTEFTFSLKDDLDLTYEGTAEDIDSAVALADESFDLDLSMLQQVLQAECPYELYWYDKTANTRQSRSYGVTVDASGMYRAYIKELTYQFPVSADYAAGSYEVDPSTGALVSRSVEAARKIVRRYSYCTDYQKMKAYKDEICDLAGYNYEVQADSSAPYGNPWQLVWVFDGDGNTNVVCEGYAKAFQYLCDLSDFENASCRIVKGSMSGGTGEGPHMWNVATMRDGNNYLVDVTNCDEGTVGEENLLFLAGCESGNPDEGYIMNAGGNLLWYGYNAQTRLVYEDADLILSETGYDDCAVPEILRIEEQPFSVLADTGETAVFRIEARGEGLTYQWQYRSPGKVTWYNSGQPGCRTEALSVPVTAARNGQSYRCVVRDETGTELISEAAELTVNNPLVITTQPESKTAKAGDVASFSVEASGRNLTYQWQYRQSGKTKWYNSSMEGSRTQTLSVPVLKTRDGQSYRCYIKDESGSSLISSAATLTVDISLAIVSQPVDASIVKGESTVFRVKAEGEKLSYQWQYCASGSTVWKNSTQNGCSSSALTVTGTLYRNGQSYRCIVKDGSGNSAVTDAAVLYVVPAEGFTLTEQPVSVTTAEGSMAEFRVAASSGGVTFRWQYRSSGKKIWMNSGMEGYATSVLKVPATIARSGQAYRCIVTDQNGNSITSEVAVLTVSTMIA